jgi:hypothetical protein
MLVAAQDADDGTRMTPRQLRDEVMTLFLAGHETTAVTLSWAWYLLAQHVEATARLEERSCAEVLGGRAPGRCRSAETHVHGRRRVGVTASVSAGVCPRAPGPGRE